MIKYKLKRDREKARTPDKLEHSPERAMFCAGLAECQKRAAPSARALSPSASPSPHVVVARWPTTRMLHSRPSVLQDCPSSCADRAASPTPAQASSSSPSSFSSAPPSSPSPSPLSFAHPRRHGSVVSNCYMTYPDHSPPPPSWPPDVSPSFIMADALSELSGHPPADPDAQATITDFIDYTEYFPSDLFRSLTLIGKLDETFLQHTANVHALTKTYAALPSLPTAERPSPQALRKDISLALHHALRCRESSYAEASRLSTVADNLTHRIRTIKRKLQAQPKPPSREPTPVPKPTSPASQRNKKTENERTPRIKLKFEDPKAIRNELTPRRRHLSRRVVVPGEVLPPFDPNSPGIDDYSDSEPEPPVTVPHRARDKTPKSHKIPKSDKLKLSRPSMHRMPGSSGTNVHSSVAGISVSNAMAQLEPPPSNPTPGSKHAPWLSLTEWELNKIRKRMKKNADWLPSEIMVKRELAMSGRGMTNYLRAKAHAEETGEEFLDEEPEDFKRPVNFKRRLSEPVFDADGEEQLVSRGMKLNEAKKLKRKMLQEAAEREEANRRITQAGLAVNSLFSQASGGLIGDLIAVEPKKSSPRKDKKRKRTSSSGQEAPRVETREELSPEFTIPPPKKIKLAPPGTTGRLTSVRTTISSNNLDITDTDSPSVNTAGAKSTTTRSGRSATSTHAKNSPKDEKPPSLAGADSERSMSRGPTSIKLKLNPTKKIESETPDRRAPPRGTKNDSLPSSATPKSKKATADSAIIANGVADIVPERRSRRSAAELLTSAEGTSKTRKSSKSSAKSATDTKKSKRRTSSTTQSVTTVLKTDPAEPVYCICGGPSSGDMIACDDVYCKREWFHLECVGLDNKGDKRFARVTWYCPNCRSKHGVKGDGIQK